MRTTVVTSGKGGVGKTNTSVNLAVCAAQAGSRVLLLDGDVGMGNADMILGIKPKADLSSLARPGVTVDDLIVRHESGLDLIAGGNGVESLLALEATGLERFLSEIAALDGRYDEVFVDTGAGIGHHVVRMLAVAERVFLVCTPDPTSIMDAYVTCKVHFSVPGAAPVWVIVNSAKSASEGEAVFRNLDTVCTKFLSRSLSLAGIVRFDERLRESVVKRCPVVLSAPNSDAARDFRAILPAIESGRPSKPRGGFADLLASAFGLRKAS